MRRSRRVCGLTVGLLGSILLDGIAQAGPPESAAERGRVALTSKSYLSPAWPLAAYKKAGTLWGPDAPDPDNDPAAYATAFNQRYGLFAAPYPNDGLPMGLRRATNSDGKVGLQLDCLVCHAGSIGGKTYIGLGNTQLDLRALLDELTLASGRQPPPRLFHLNTARGTNNAGQIAITLLSFRNPDLSFRTLPLLTGANLPELDTPAWWILGKKTTKYYDGRTAARSARSNMQFYLGELSLQELKDLEPTFNDIDAYLKSITPPKYPFPIDSAKADRGRIVFERTCSKCHGTYGPDGSYPNKVVPLEVIRTDPARAKGLTDRFIAHYNTTWFGEDYPVVEPLIGYQAPPLDGLWATAPYLHNGSAPTLYHVLKSAERPSRFKRPTSTDFAHYDTEKVGWKFEVVPAALDPKTPAQEAVSVYETSRWGLGNGGHMFGDKLTEEERMAVIEYLKTL